MNKNILQAIYATILLLLGTVTLNAQTELKIGIFINDFSMTNTDASFYADFYWWCKIPITVDEHLVDDYANLEFVNAKSDIIKGITEKKKLKDFYYITGFCKGSFNYYPEFRDYPKDQQKIPIIIESVNLPLETIILAPDEKSFANPNFQGFNEKIKLNEFKILSSRFNKSSTVYNTSFGDPAFSVKSNYSRLNYEILIKRNSFSYLIKIIIPCLLLSIIAYLVFFIPAAKLDVAVGCTVTSLLACIAVQLTTVGDIPRVGYLTKSTLR